MGDTEVGDLHGSVLDQEDIRRLDVAVDDALAMRIVERIEHLRHDANDVGNGEPLVRLEILLELAALDELHGDEPDAVVLAEIVDRNDVGMAEPSRRLGLAAEARNDGRRCFACQLIGANGLERNNALDHRIVAFVDHAHCAAADLSPHFVFAEVTDVCHASPLPAPESGDAGGVPASRIDASIHHLYLASISQTDFCTRRCTIVSSETPPCCDCDTPSTDDDLAPTSIFSSVYPCASCSVVSALMIL